MTIHNDLDVQATAFWLEVPEHPQQGVVYAGNQRPFETVRNGVRYVMKQLPAHQRGTAQITTDYGMNYDIRDIESAYAALSPPSSDAVGKGEAGAFQAGPFDPSSFEVAAEQIAASQPPGL